MKVVDASMRQGMTGVVPLMMSCQAVAWAGVAALAENEAGGGQIFGNLTQRAPRWEDFTTVPMKAMPARPSAMVGKS
mgnify:CR=1 FL=1